LFCSDLEISEIKKQILAYNGLQVGSDAWTVAQAPDGPLSTLQKRLLGFEEERRSRRNNNFAVSESKGMLF
jgi:hypothetical protein